MIFRSTISAGELFELIRPAALVLSALLSSWVFASARRHEITSPIALAWALATLIFPFIVIPLFLITRSRRRKLTSVNDSFETNALAAQPHRRWSVNLAYMVMMLSGLGVYLYSDYEDIDSHLARAAQARLRSDHNLAIKEYRTALLRIDDAHTHKLLGLELAAVGLSTEALGEFRLAEKGGEPDDLLAYRIAIILGELNQHNQATLEYERFLQTRVCTQDLPARECIDAQRQLGKN